MEIRITKATAIAVALIVAGVLLRLVPHAANFAPVGAIALFGGAVLSPRLAWWLPVAIMIISDLILGFHGTILFTWGGFMLVALLGMTLKEKSNWLRVPAGAIGGALIFYIVSNFGVWAEGKLYLHTLQGLIDCYIAGLPFLKTSLLADLFFSGALFGAYHLATKPLNQPLTEQET
jgi:hypothetical protein